MIDEEPSNEELNKMCLCAENKKLIIVRNKIDKTENKPFTLVKIPLIDISAKYGTHLSDLEQTIYQAGDIPTLSEADFIVTNARHYDALKRAHEDLLSEDLRQALDTLAEITGGQITPNEVLGNIFKNFCVGK